MTELFLPFQFPFMQNALFAVTFIAPAAALLSCFLVLKGWALMGDATSHAVLPGVVLAYLAGIPLLIGAFVAGLLCAIATGYITENSRIKQDTVMGVVFSGMFGFGLLLYTKIDTSLHLDHILFGNILGIERHDLWRVSAISTLIAFIILVKWRDILLYSFDLVQSQVIGLQVPLLHYGLLSALSAMIVAMLSSVGIILSVAYLIAPGAIAFLLTRTFQAMMLVAVATSLAAGGIGVLGAFWLDAAPAPTIVLCLSCMFLLALRVRSLRRM